MNTPANPIDGWINDEVERHKRWRRTWSFAYFSTAALTIVAGAATTAIAGLLGPNDMLGPMRPAQWATLLAAVTTILASLEKVLRLREKWDLHRNIQTSLEMIKLKRASSLTSDKKAIELIDKVAQMYSSQLAELSAPSATTTTTLQSTKPPEGSSDDS